MIAHRRGCVRGDWLIARPKLGLFWTVLFQEGPVCDCGAGPTVQRLNSPVGVTQGAGDPTTRVN
jgi:hypothetical protein